MDEADASGLTISDGTAEDPTGQVPAVGSARKSRVDWAVFCAGSAFVVVCFAVSLVIMLGPNPSSLPNPDSYFFDPGWSTVINETRDSVAWALAVVLAITFAAIATRRQPRFVTQQQGLLVAALAIAEVALIVWAVADVDVRIPAPPHWGGFGWLRLLAAIVVGPIVIWVLYRRWLTRTLGVIATVVVTVVYLPAMFQPIGSLQEPYHTGYAINELLAPAAGQFPLVDYIPQYTALLGYPISWVSSSATAAASVGAAYITILQYLTLLASCATVLIAMRSWRGLWIVLVTVFPLMLIVQDPILGNSFAGYATSLPLRTVMPMLLAVFMVIVSDRRGRWWAFSVGLFAGITALNNLDFGLPAAGVACLSFLLISRIHHRFLRDLPVVIGGVVLPTVVYGLIAQLAAGQVHLDYWLVWPLSFGAIGLAKVPMPSTGLQWVMFGCFAAGVVFGAATLWRLRDSAPSAESVANTARRAQLCLFLSGWGLLALIYYAGRSYVPTLQNFMLQLAPLIALLALWSVDSGYVRSVLDDVRNLRAHGQSAFLSLKLVAVPFVLLAGLGVVALSFGPSPAHEIDRIRAGLAVPADALVGTGRLRPGQNVPLASVGLQIRSAARSPSLAGLKVGTLAWDGHLLEISSGVPSAMIVNEPDDLGVRIAMDVQCSYLHKTGFQVLLVNVENPDAWLAKRFGAGTDCPSFIPMGRLSASSEIRVLARSDLLSTQSEVAPSLK
ncbi:MAG: hypothetical protein WCP28_16330 [Actinomycetes bacterium]